VIIHYQLRKQESAESKIKQPGPWKYNDTDATIWT